MRKLLIIIVSLFSSGLYAQSGFIHKLAGTNKIVEKTTNMMSAYIQWMAGEMRKGVQYGESCGEKLVPAFMDLLNMRLAEQEKEKTIAKLTTDYAKFDKLSSRFIEELAQFSKVTSIYAGVVPPDESNDVTLFITPLNPDAVSNDEVLVMFMNGKCVGVGSLLKGLYARYPEETFSAGMYELSVYNMGKEQKFRTLISVGLKKNIVLFCKPQINGKYIIQQ